MSNSFTLSSALHSQGQQQLQQLQQSSFSSTPSQSSQPQSSLPLCRNDDFNSVLFMRINEKDDGETTTNGCPEQLLNYNKVVDCFNSATERTSIATGPAKTRLNSGPKNAETYQLIRKAKSPGQSQGQGNLNSAQSTTTSQVNMTKGLPPKLSLKSKKLQISQDKNIEQTVNNLTQTTDNPTRNSNQQIQQQMQQLNQQQFVYLNADQSKLRALIMQQAQQLQQQQQQTQQQQQQLQQSQVPQQFQQLPQNQLGQSTGTINNAAFFQNKRPQVYDSGFDSTCSTTAAMESAFVTPRNITPGSSLHTSFTQQLHVQPSQKQLFEEQQQSQQQQELVCAADSINKTKNISVLDNSNQQLCKQMSELNLIPDTQNNQQFQSSSSPAQTTPRDSFNSQFLPLHYPQHYQYQQQQQSQVSYAFQAMHRQQTQQQQQQERSRFLSFSNHSSSQQQQQQQHPFYQSTQSYQNNISQQQYPSSNGSTNQSFQNIQLFSPFQLDQSADSFSQNNGHSLNSLNGSFLDGLQSHRQSRSFKSESFHLVQNQQLLRNDSNGQLNLSLLMQQQQQQQYSMGQQQQQQRQKQSSSFYSSSSSSSHQHNQSLTLSHSQYQQQQQQQSQQSQLNPPMFSNSHHQTSMSSSNLQKLITNDNDNNHRYGMVNHNLQGGIGQQQQQLLTPNQQVKSNLSQSVFIQNDSNLSSSISTSQSSNGSNTQPQYIHNRRHSNGFNQQFQPLNSSSTQNGINQVIDAKNVRQNMQSQSQLCRKNRSITNHQIEQSSIVEEDDDRLEGEINDANSDENDDQDVDGKQGFIKKSEQKKGSKGMRKRKVIAQEEESNYLIAPENVKSDGRTTVMIKNIPNKYTLQALMEKIDENHAKTYDFFYLPIDFRNKCNVGYAFINFVNPEFIKPFFEEFHNQKWVKFNSEKVCLLVYARLQGRSALIHHFQHSSVMNQKDKKLKPVILPKNDILSFEQFLKNQKGNMNQISAQIMLCSPHTSSGTQQVATTTLTETQVSQKKQEKEDTIKNNNILPISKKSPIPYQ